MWGWISSDQLVGLVISILFLIIFGIAIGFIMFRKEILFGIKIIAVLYFIAAICTSIIGIILIYLNIIRAEIPIYGWGGFTEGYIHFGEYPTIIAAIFFIGLAIFNFFIVKGLLKKQNWARKATIILVILWIIGAYIGTMGGLGWTLVIFIYGLPLLVINIIIISYLMLNRKVKVAFYKTLPFQ